MTGTTGTQVSSSPSLLSHSALPRKVCASLLTNMSQSVLLVSYVKQALSISTPLNTHQNKIRSTLAYFLAKSCIYEKPLDGCHGNFIPRIAHPVNIVQNILMFYQVWTKYCQIRVHLIYRTILQKSYVFNHKLELLQQV